MERERDVAKWARSPEGQAALKEALKKGDQAVEQIARDVRVPDNFCFQLVC